MTISYKLTERNWHPSSLLAYDALTNDQNESTISDAKSTVGTGTDFYDRSLTSRRYALAGVAFSIIFSFFCIVAGTVILATLGGSGEAPTVKAVMLAGSFKNITEILTLALNLIVTLCTESAGFVHTISLHSALASESRLRFNTNLRLLTAAGSWINTNGALLNSIMAVLLILSYVSASMVISLTVHKYDEDSASFVPYVGIAGLPLLFLGVVLFLQVAITLSGAHAVKVLTWSCSPFDLTAALVHHAQLTPVPFRCMRPVSDLDMDWGPVRPSETQPSAWRAHPSIRKVVIFLWGLVVACAGWAALVILLSTETANTSNYVVLPKFQGIGYMMPGPSFWLTCVNMGLVQGPLTLGLHCSELIANVIRDERRWRCATGRDGLRTAMNPLKSFFTNPLGLVLFIAKPVLHWMFGLAFSLSDGDELETMQSIAVTMYTVKILYLCLAMFVLACFFTLVALLRPRGAQPAAYGHLQTLANLVDEWSPVMWWGHKEDGIPYCHAGTSDHLLPAVKMDCIYAGSSVHL